jgi:hypothetical protein
MAERATDQVLREAFGEVAREWFALAEQVQWLDQHYEEHARNSKQPRP